MAGNNPFSKFRSRVFAALIGCLCLVGLFFLPACHAQAAVIVLDPGHGGSDGGAGSGNESAEKQFTLALAHQIADRLAARHRVQLTRTSDIQMAPEERAAVANHLRADLVISLHAAVAPYCSDRTAAVYYHNDERLWMPSGTSLQGTLPESDTDRPAWSMLQIRHQHQSQRLAATFKQALEDTGTFDSVTVGGVPLVALMGADLPAVMVEVGCIHPTAAPNPQTFKQLLDGYAESIAKAIETALSGLVR